MAAEIKSYISPKEQDRNWKLWLDEIRERSLKERCHHWKKFFQPYQRYGDKDNGVFVQQMIIMEAFFNLCGNQIRHCVKLEQREPLTDLSIHYFKFRNYNISFDTQISNQFRKWYRFSKTWNFLFYCARHTTKYLLNGINYIVLALSHVELIRALTFVKVCKMS